MTRKQMALILTVLSAIPVFIPIGLPIPIGYTTKDFYNTIQNLKEGGMVALAFQMNLANYVPYRSGYTAMLLQLFTRKAKLICYSFYADTPQVWQALFTYVNMEKYNYRYGVDYVIFPFLSGEESALATIAANMRVFTTDIYGTNTEDIPLMANVRTLSDVDLAITSYSSNDFADMFVRQWPAKYGVKALTSMRAYGDVAQHYKKYIFGCEDRPAEYEKLTGYPGEDLIIADANNVTLIFIWISILLGNMAYFADRRKKFAVPTGQVRRE
jgi:hypothetical protein